MKLINIASIALAIFTLILTIVFFIWWANKDEFVFGSERFDQTKWMQYAETLQKDCRRGDLAYDLQKNILLPGAQKQAVMALLGRPSFEDKNAIEYDLGKCMHVYHGLLINFDNNDRLINSRISSH